MGGKWIAKAVLQKGMSFLPDPQRANYFFQDRVTHATTLHDDFFQMRIEWSALHLDSLRRLGDPSPGFAAVELGSGWYPIVPLCLFLAGAGSVELVDLKDLSRPELVRQAVDGVVAAQATGSWTGSVRSMRSASGAYDGRERGSARSAMSTLSPSWGCTSDRPTPGPWSSTALRR